MTLSRRSLLAVVAGSAIVLSAVGHQAQAQSETQNKTQEEPVDLTFASFNVGGSWYIYASTLASIAAAALPEGSTVEVLPYQGGVGNPILVGRGEADLGLSFSALSNWATKGIVGFSEPLPDIRALLGGLNVPHRLGIMVREDLGIDSLDDVATTPVRLVTVQRGGAGEQLAQMALGSYGLSYDDVIAAGGTVTHIDLPVAIQQMRDGQADMFIHNIGYRQPDVMELALGGDFTFIPLGEEQMAQIVKDYGLQGGLSIREGEFEGVDAAVPSVGYPTGVIVNVAMDDDVAYTITKAICEHQDEVRAAHSSLAEFDCSKADEPERNGGVELHPGAARYFGERASM